MYILQFLHLFSSSLDFIEKTAKDHEKESLREKIIEKCEELLPRDIRDNKSMGQHGASHILNSKGCHNRVHKLKVHMVLTN